ncbi:NTE family protein [Pseudoduganella lurida]|uniref:NTE family protein n=1 Tax=Pseudoduganella lurida TaxID=1036180 RepID=A0A562RE84_9BURK|nr:NTE family protein [Pseudoduganella lurida]
MIRETRPVSLGLQGGGTYGAFTWGVLDRLLDEEHLQFDSFSGSSAGAINAVVLADGYAHGGGRQGARAALTRFWTTLGSLATFSPMGRTPLDRLLGGWAMDLSPAYHLLEMAGALAGPTLETPLSMNPLRNFLTTMVDFDRVRGCEELQLFIAATNVKTGLGRMFTRAELDPQRVLASACLPTVFAAAEVDGESYWDGSYVANPPLAPLLERPARDVIVVQNNPIARATAPRSQADIANRSNEIAFNISFAREMSTLLNAGGVPEEGRGATMTFAPVRVHLISGAELLAQYEISSKFNAEMAFLQHLHDAGVAAAETWLQEHGANLGVRTTVDKVPVFYPDRAASA